MIFAAAHSRVTSLASLRQFTFCTRQKHIAQPRPKGTGLGRPDGNDVRPAALHSQGVCDIRKALERQRLSKAAFTSESFHWWWGGKGKSAKRRQRRIKRAVFEAAARLAAPLGVGNRNAATVLACSPLNFFTSLRKRPRTRWRSPQSPAWP